MSPLCTQPTNLTYPAKSPLWPMGSWGGGGGGSLRKGDVEVGWGNGTVGGGEDGNGIFTSYHASLTMTCLTMTIINHSSDDRFVPCPKETRAAKGWITKVSESRMYHPRVLPRRYRRKVIICALNAAEETVAQLTLGGARSDFECVCTRTDYEDFGR